jgi:hypothetical protein
MKAYFRSILAISTLIFAGACSDFKTQGDKVVDREDESEDMFIMDDMIVRKSQVTRADVSTQGTGGISYWGTRPWPNGIVNFEFAPEFSKFETEEILDACREWAQHAKIECRKRQNDEWPFSRVEKNPTAQIDGCAADVGASLEGSTNPMKLYLTQSRCFYRSTLVHEMGHVLGLIHEHQRPDRDNFVDIHTDLIQPDSKYNFEKWSTLETHAGYDFLSIMHYHRFSWGINLGDETITPKPEYEEYRTKMGNQYQLSDGDKASAVFMYGAKGSSTKSLTLRLLDTETRQALRDAMITIIGDAGFQKEYTTDSFGYVRSGHIAQDNYRLSVKAQGYLDKEQSLMLDSEKSVEITLEKRPVVIEPAKLNLRIMVQSKGKAVSGAKVTTNGQSQTTNSSGLVDFGPQLIQNFNVQVKASGYKDYKFVATPSEAPVTASISKVSFFKRIFGF